MKDHRGGLDIFCNIVEPPTTNDLPVAEYALFSRYLCMEKFRTDGIAFAILAKRATYSGQEDTCFCHA
jgi:hypothetical protein